MIITLRIAVLYFVSTRTASSCFEALVRRLLSCTVSEHPGAALLLQWYYEYGTTLSSATHLYPVLLPGPQAVPLPVAAHLCPRTFMHMARACSGRPLGRLDRVPA